MKILAYSLSMVLAIASCKSNGPAEAILESNNPRMAELARIKRYLIPNKQVEGKLSNLMTFLRSKHDGTYWWIEDHECQIIYGEEDKINMLRTALRESEFANISGVTISN
ncbi:MAG: hypothetical protein HY286_18120 [Planctomycetes bacterium]|nr:hypothetical protein [Planctomycetota bacterium]